MGAKLKKLPGLNSAVNELKKQGLDKKELIEDFEDELDAKLSTLMGYVDISDVLKKMNFHQKVMVMALGELIVECDKVMAQSDNRSQEYVRLIANINLTQQQLMQNLMQNMVQTSNHFGVLLM